MAEPVGRHPLCGRHVPYLVGHSAHHLCRRAGSVLNCGLPETGCQLGLHHPGSDVQERPDVGAAAEQCGGAREELPATDPGSFRFAQHTAGARRLGLHANQEFIPARLWSRSERFQLAEVPDISAGKGGQLVPEASR